MISDMTPKQRALAEYMSDLSEDAYCAGWLVDLEYLLWEEVLGRRGKYRFPCSQEEVARLRELSEECGGWIVFEKKTWETWLPLAEWEKRFAKWEKRRKSS